MTTRIQQPQQITSASFTLSSQSPSFSSENIADIAARVVKELNLSHSDDPFDDEFYLNAAFRESSSDQTKISDDHHDDHDEEDEVDDDFYLNASFRESSSEQTKISNDDHDENDKDEVDDDDDDDDESEFEFVILNSSPISADEIFSNGQIKPMFPVFGQNDPFGATSTPKTMRLPLRKLLETNQNGVVSSSSSSSSDADDLEGVPPGTYCVWTPKKKEEVLQMRKKSKSTGFPSKRWRFRDLLHRSNSDGKDTFVFLTPVVKGGANGGDGKRREKMVRRVGGDNGNGKSNGGKKKTYLPYRQDLVGFFANVNGISRTVRPF